MNADFKEAQKKIRRLTRKVAVLESMIEDRSRQEYYEEQRRSIINALLETSLKANDVDGFLSKVLDLLFSMEPLCIEKKGAVFLFDNNSENLVLHAQIDLHPNRINSILSLTDTPHLCKEALSNNAIFHSYQPPGRFHQHQPDTEPHGHYYVTIKTNSKVYGVIILYFNQNLPRNNEDIIFFTSVADICAGSLERMYYSRKILDYQQNLKKKVAAQTIELSMEKERLAVTLRSIGDGVITTDTSGNVIFLNKVAEQLTGWTNEGAVGRPLQEIFHIMNQETGRPCTDPVEKIFQSGIIVDLDQHTILRDRNDIERRIDVSGAPIHDMESRIIGVVLVFRDITEQLKTEQELLKIKKLECVGVLAGGIAHDFNNILSAILGNIELARLDSDLKDGTEKLLQDAEKASVRAKGLTQQLLTFAKGGEPIKEASSIKDIIQDSAEFILHGGNVSCRFSIPDDLWFADIDRGQISQVIQNLVLNAVQANADGGLIKISCTNIESPDKEKAQLPHGNKYVKIEISDDGDGIPTDVITRIFDPYFTTKQEGSGLGLAITHSIIIQHDGRITVKSKPGMTTFTIYLPTSSREEPIKLQQQQAPLKKTGKTRILFMDDDEMLQNLVKKMLTLFGHEVVPAANGQEAIDAFKNADPPIDLIIMDLTIPGGMGGKQAVQEILTIDSEAKVIVTSGYSHDPIMANFKNYGFSAAVAKPFQLQELTDTINTILAR